MRYIYQVQSFFRGWLCRRRWKQIVDEYIRSDHAESMRKRNRFVIFFAVFLHLKHVENEKKKMGKQDLQINKEYKLNTLFDFAADRQINFCKNIRGPLSWSTRVLSVR